MCHLYRPPPPSKLAVLLNSPTTCVLSTIKAQYDQVNVMMDSHKLYVVSHWRVKFTSLRPSPPLSISSPLHQPPASYLPTPSFATSPPLAFWHSVCIMPPQQRGTSRRGHAQRGTNSPRATPFNAQASSDGFDIKVPASLRTMIDDWEDELNS